MAKPACRKIARTSVSPQYKLQRLDRLSLSDSSVFVLSSAKHNHRQFENYPEIVIKLVCVNSSAN